MNAERIQKVLARQGLGSRREIERWLQQGRILVDEKVPVPGLKLQGNENVTLDGWPVTLRIAVERQVLLYFKPDDEVCTRHDPQGRATVFDHLPEPKTGKWIAVGRLDLTTTGLLLFTTDGELANQLMHPSSQIEREYAVRTLGDVTEQMISVLCNGVQLEDGSARFDSVHDMGGQGANHWYRVVLREGRKHEVKRLWESQGIRVSRLKRIRFGPIVLNKNMQPGESRLLAENEVRRLLASISKK